jgi:3-isopropylmalate/(R)-2-methylmalate dehydratase small subunit
MKRSGRAHTYGDHVNTDVIIPARFLNDPSLQNMAAHCMEDIDSEFTRRVRPDDVIVGGADFGCGSSREHAPMAIKAARVSCVVAASFARIFFRNAINIGLPVMECPEAARAISMGDALTIDLALGEILDVTTGESFRAAPFPPFMQKIVAAGGLVNYTKRQLEGAAREV